MAEEGLRIRVPATSANLGPGFDSLGLAVGLYLDISAAPADLDSFRYRGEDSVPETSDNLIHRGFRAVFAALGRSSPPVAIEADNPIPLARGLGSSSAALVGGAALADAWLGGPLGRRNVFRLVAELEGHPDNVAPAVFGGFTVSIRGGGGYESESLPFPEDWLLLFGVPSYPLPTETARSVLPDSYPRSAAVFTGGRTALWTLAVAQGRPELLKLASEDVLHEPYREPLVPGLGACRRELLERGAYAAFLSGAGPTIGVITGRARHEACREVLQEFAGPAGRVLELPAGRGYSLHSPATGEP